MDNGAVHIKLNDRLGLGDSVNLPLIVKGFEFFLSRIPGNFNHFTNVAAVVLNRNIGSL